jgi:hypothetical protein
MGTSNALSTKAVLNQIREVKPILSQQFDVKDLAVFGSTVRGEHHEKSDIDIWVTFHHAVNAKAYFGVQFYLEDLLGRPVDLVTDKAMRPELRPFIEQEAVYV